MTILPASVLRMDRGHGLMSRPIQSPKIDREVGLIQLKGRSLSPAAGAFLKALRDGARSCLPAGSSPDLFRSSISHIREFKLLRSHPDINIDGVSTHNRRRRYEPGLRRGLCWLALLAACPAEGRVVRLVVEHRENAGDRTRALDRTFLRRTRPEACAQRRD